MECSITAADACATAIERIAVEFRHVKASGGKATQQCQRLHLQCTYGAMHSTNRRPPLVSGSCAMPGMSWGDVSFLLLLRLATDFLQWRVVVQR